MNLTDNQWYNFICGLITGRYTKRRTIRTNFNGSAAEINRKDLDNTYQIVFITNEDGDIDTPGSLSCYLVGGSTAPNLTLHDFKIEVAPTNPTPQIALEMYSASQSSAPLTANETAAYFLNHCPIQAMTVTPAESLTVLQNYRSAKVSTSSAGAMTINHQHNLVVSFDNDIYAEAACQIHLFDIQATWQHDVVLNLNNPSEVYTQPYLAGDIQVETGLNTVYSDEGSLKKLPVRSASLMFGDPQERSNYKTIAALQEREPSLPPSSEIPCYPSEQSKQTGGYIEYRIAVPYTADTGDWVYHASTGLGGEWRVKANTTPETTQYIRHRVYPTFTGSFDTSLTVTTPSGETKTIAVEYEVIQDPTVPRIATSVSKYLKSRLGLLDNAIINITSAAAPEVEEHLALTDDVVLAVVAPPIPPEVDEHLQLTDDTNIDVYSPVYPDGNEHIQLEDTANIDVYTPPSADKNDEHLSLADNTNVNINSPANQAEINIVI